MIYNIYKLAVPTSKALPEVRQNSKIHFKTSIELRESQFWISFSFLFYMIESFYYYFSIIFFFIIGNIIFLLLFKLTKMKDYDYDMHSFQYWKFSRLVFPFFILSEIYVDGGYRHHNW